MILLISGNTFGKSVSANNLPDSITMVQTVVMLDDPNLRICDSIYKNSYQLIGQNFRNDFANYDFTSEEIPSQLDSLYRYRINMMDIKSPFDFEYNKDVRNYIYLYTEKIPSLISRVLTVKNLYFPLFEQILDKYQLPIELKYLAIVESSLNPVAISRAGAGGLWQFMPSTGRMYDLEINSNIDDRMNPYKATEAACRHFIDLYNSFHDWNLVLAAYNAGSGTINRALKKVPEGSPTDYWSIRKYLPKETQGYVPAFIAVNYAMKYYFAHNIQAREINTIPFHLTDTLHINNELSFEQISQWLEIPIETLQMLNPQYRKSTIPATNNPNGNILCLPYDRIGDFIANEKTILAGIRHPKYSDDVAIENSKSIELAN